MVHAASQEMVAMTGHLPRLAQQQTSSFKHPEQASAVRLSRANACPLYPHFMVSCCGRQGGHAFKHHKALDASV